MDKRTGDIAEFTEAAGKLLSGSSLKTLAAATKELDRLFRKNANPCFLRADLPGMDEKITLGGYALMPFKAVACLRDSARTAGFAKGLFDAINVAKKTFTDRPIRVLYAGCGPFATFAMIVAPFFKKGEVEFTAIDVYEASYACAEGVAKNLGQADKFKEIKWGDATNYKVNGKRPHIIITETMQAQLLNEPQPQITADLGDQVEESGIFIPNLVEVKAFAGNVKDSGDSDFPLVIDMAPLGELFRLTPEIAGRVKDCNGHMDMEKLMKELTVDKSFPVPASARNLEKLIIQTRVHIFGSEWLTGDTPTVITRRIIDELKSFGELPDQIRFSYVAGQNRKIRIKYIDKSGSTLDEKKLANPEK